MKNFLTLLVIREMKIKATMRDYYIRRMDKIFKRN